MAAARLAETTAGESGGSRRDGGRGQLVDDELADVGESGGRPAA